MSGGTPLRKKVRPLMGEPPRCSAHKTDGTPCRQRPIPGGSVCYWHGGAAPQVRKKAQERLTRGILPLLGHLYRLATDEEIPPNVRLAAIRDWLDRAGLNAKQEIELTVAPWQEMLEGVVSDVPEDGNVTTRAHTYPLPGPPAHDVIAGEVVDDEASEAR